MAVAPHFAAAVLARAGVGLLVHDAAGRIVYANPAAETQLGLQVGPDATWSPSAQGSWCDDDEHPLPPEHHPARLSMDSGLAVDDAVIGTRAADGSRRWLSVSAAQWDDAAGGSRFVVSTHTDITQRQQREVALRDAAERDRLTGLPNRAQLLLRLEQALLRAEHEAGWRVAVLFLDFDRFKLVNDTMGHDAGDELLMGVADRLRSRLAEGRWGEAFAARFGGDEFVVVCGGLADVAPAEDLATQLVIDMAVPFMLKGQEFQSGVSIGISISTEPVPGVHDLMRNADTAMYEAKRAGRRTWVVFDQGMHDRLARSVQLESAMRHALSRNEFHLVYQPIVDLETGQLASVEALLRWRHAGLGWVEPAEFLPIAEESGHILAIGEWVINEVCRQWAAWQQQDARHAPSSLSINLSRVQIALGPQLVTLVHNVLERYGVPPEALQLEITERDLMKDPAAIRELLFALASLGVRLVMDDYGTGTSSLGRLRDYPFHAIKIDRSFVTGMTRDRQVIAVAHATVNVIENLGMVSIAEGVETRAEVATLQAMGCRFGQGQLFAPPVPADQLLTTVSRYLVG